MRQAFICDGVRTAIGRYAGQLKDVRPDDMGAHVIKALCKKISALDTTTIDDVIFGCANQAGEDNRNIARMCSLLAGLPTSVPGVTVNRLCGSGLNAVSMAANAIHSGDADLIIAGGVESMSRAPFVVGKAEQAFSRGPFPLQDTTIGWRFVNTIMDKLYGTDSMPETAENVAEQYDISRYDQDVFAALSQQKYAKALANGIFKEEIIPIHVPQRRADDLIVDTDEHPRPSSTADKLAALKPITKLGGTVTAGNASGVNDGAAALLIASEDKVNTLQLNPIARVMGTVVHGVEPSVMGIGPLPATERLLNRFNLTIKDIDVLEINEAFAAQALAVMRGLGLDDHAEHVNPNGGAIALGHPLGMSGARILLTAAKELRRRGGKFAIATMCVGVGQGISTLIAKL